MLLNENLFNMTIFKIINSIQSLKHELIPDLYPFLVVFKAFLYEYKKVNIKLLISNIIDDILKDNPRYSNIVNIKLDINIIVK